MHKVLRYFRSGVPQKLTSAASSNSVSSITSRRYISELVVGSKARSLSSSDDSIRALGGQLVDPTCRQATNFSRGGSAMDQSDSTHLDLPPPCRTGLMTARPTVRLSSRPTSVSACPERTSTRLDTLPFSTSQPKESVRTHAV